MLIPNEPLQAVRGGGAPSLMTPQEAIQRVNRMYRILSARATEARELKSFYAGHQPLAFASDEWRKQHQDRYKDFADNWCEVVANSTSERIAVIGFKLPSSTQSRQSKAEKFLYDSWLRNEQDSLSAQGFLESIIARRSYALVWGDAGGEPIINWKSSEQAMVWYDAETGRRREYGFVVWDDLDRQLEFGTLYTPDWVYKFSRASVYKGDTGLILPELIFAGGGGWEYRESESGPNHLGVVPLVEFQNRPILGVGPLSDISGTTAMQNAINLLWAYLFNAADYASMPARVVMGQSPPKIPILDPVTGEKVGERPVDEKALTQGRMLWLTGQNTQVGQWDAAKLDVFTAVIEQAVGHIAAQTRTPPHYLVANKGISNISGDALKAAEVGLVRKADQAAEFFEPRVRDLFELIALQLGDDKMAAEARLGVVKWKDRESRSEGQSADAMQKNKAAGYPFEYLLEKQGHSPSEIKRIMAMAQAEQQQAMMVGVSSLINAPIGSPGGPPPGVSAP